MLGTLSLSFEVLAPAALSVADAQAEEGTDATLDFAVTLDRESTGDGDGGLRHIRRHGDGGVGLHGDLRHAHLRRGRHVEDGLGAGAGGQS